VDGGGGGGFGNFFLLGEGPFARDSEICRVCYGPPVSLQVSWGEIEGPKWAWKKRISDLDKILSRRRDEAKGGGRG
jgi:hypothetical protein